VHWNPVTRNLVVEDNGIGMDFDIIRYHLMRVGASFYDTPQFAVENRDFTPISRFGIGILTCFMISDDIEIVTIKGTKGYRIRMTSVHADYLLRELEPGDQKLEGIEPHGTRVTLAIRGTGKLPKGGINEILKYWVILPECGVELIESGSTPVKIGFDSPVEALQYWHEASDVEIGGLSKSRVEFITKTRRMELTGESCAYCASYEMVFAVKSSLLPERSFISKEKYITLPAVCIEGIRVSDSLPGLKPYLGAVLSVRNDRKFRTTVSRQGLEKDDHFDKIAYLCAEMLFEHIKDDINRIAVNIGRPLSQASSASVWLYRDLVRICDKLDVKSYIDSLYQQLESIVVERIQEKDGKPTTIRSLISRNNLIDESEIWTIESRLVDSLGIISRDLGRELSLNEFLIALAPDFKNLEYTPIIPDAHLFGSIFSKSHIPERVEFSIRHQQSAVKWVKCNENESLGIDPERLCNSEFWRLMLGRAEKRVYREEYGSGDGDYVWLSQQSDIKLGKFNIEVAEIKGDDDAMQGVITRVGTILRIGSEIGNMWLSLREIFFKCLLMEDLDQFINILGLLTVFEDSLGQRPRHSNQEGKWGMRYEVLRPLIKEMGLIDKIPDNYRYIWDIPIFNASSYWRDWFEH
jgi:molecular chaperone HtpG